MRLAEKDPTGEPLYQCDMCQIAGLRDVTIIEENGGHLCMSCWCEKERNRARRGRAVVVEH